MRNALFLFQKIERCGIIAHERSAKKFGGFGQPAQTLDNFIRNGLAVNDHILSIVPQNADYGKRARGQLRGAASRKQRNLIIF